MKVKNTQTGPRGLNTVNGPVLVEPGATFEGEVYARERTHIEAAGWFEVEGKYKANPDQPAEASNPSEEVEALKLQVADLEKQVAELTKQVPETDIEKMTVPELRAHLAFHDVAYDGSKDKKEDLVARAKAKAA